MCDINEVAWWMSVEFGKEARAEICICEFSRG